MTLVHALVARARGALRGLSVTPAELAALGLLLCGGLLVLAALWWLTPRDEGWGPTAAPAGEPDHADHDPTGGAPVEDGDGEDLAQGGALALATEDVVVHVAGAVEEPGLYTLAGGSRIADALAAAGGTTGEAVTDGVNLARPVRDGEQLHVPDRALVEALADGSTSAGAGPAGASPPGLGVRPDGRLDINRADAAALEGLPGVGPVLAQRIIAHREAHGPFARPEDLLEVSGIGERTFEAMAELVDT